MTTPMVEVAALRHGHGSRDILDIPAWRVDAGEPCLVAGPSGSGKSTLLHLLAGLATPREGSVRVAGQGPPAARDRFRGHSIGLAIAEAMRHAATGVDSSQSPNTV